MKLSLLSMALAAVLVSGAVAQTPPPAPKQEPGKQGPATPQTPQTPAGKTDEKKAEEKKEEKKEDKRTDLQKKYDEIAKKAKTQTGVFKVHRVDEKIYWEIPESKLGRVMMWQTEISEIPKELGFVGTPVGTRTIRFTKRDNKLQLRNATFATRAVGTDEGTLAGVAANTPEPILVQWDLSGESSDKDKGLLVDVTSMFNSDPQDFSIRGAIPGFQGVDSSKTYIDRVKAFPKNIETRTAMTIRVGGGRAMNPFGGGGNYDASTASIVVHYSLVELPEKPMMGRLKDSRIGFFTVGFTEFGREDSAASKVVEYISRFRLEKKDPKAELSEPVEPITFYLAREVPVKWRKYIKEGIESWKPAFEQAGFKNAIVAKDAPTLKEDPEWDAEDARYSVIRWAPSETMNAMGPSIQDPRSGETISAHVIFWNDIVNFQDMYFAQAAAIDPRARKLPFSDELIGDLIRYVAAHEVGHTLGLEHNFRGSVAYSVKELRDPQFTKEHGVAASIMSYSRFNYVAQPGDGVTNTMGQIGPYDKFAIEYGYKPLNKSNPEAEKPQLDMMLAEQIRNPHLRFGNYKYMGIDPTTQTELIGEDTVEATRLGLINIERIAKNYLVSGTTKYGESYERLAGARDALMVQYLTELSHVVAVVGGVVENDTHAGRGDAPVFRPVPAVRQRAAVALLLEQGIRMPAALQDPNLVYKLAPTGSYDANPAQGYVISGLLNESRLRRLSDNEAVGKGSYTVAMLTGDVFRGVFKDLGYQTVGNAKTAAPALVLDANTRALHRNFLRTLDGRINGSSATRTDLKAIAKMELRGVAKTIDANMARAKDPVTAAHLAETRSDIVKILEDKYAKAGAAPTFNLMELLMGGATGARPLPGNCWFNPLTAAIKKASAVENGG